ncbi:MAG: type II toxin-antitoxin system VapC family toxin, partial [Armatimonadota bacterium]
MADRIFDASALVKTVLPEPGSDRVGKLLTEAADGLTHVYVLDIAVVESVNVIWKRQQRRDIGPQEALEALQQLDRVLDLITIVRSRPHLRRGLEIGMALSLAIYDSVVVACAEADGLTMLTEDSRQAETASQLSPPVQVELLGPESDA